MKKSIFYYTAIVVILFLFDSFLAGFLPNASAICCFPYNMNYYIDPITGDLVINGELLNDSYKREPFGNVKYQFLFSDKDNNQILERSILLTDGLPLQNGAIIPYVATFPFQIVLYDVDENTVQQISHFYAGGAETLDYFSRKPADLVVSSNEPVNIGTISGKNGDVFNRWQISGNVTNTHSQKTQNVYVVASIRNENDNIIGVAGYSNDSVQPVTLDGLETKSFVIKALVPASETPASVIVYAESDESSMVHQYYKPIIMRDATNHEGKITSDPKKPIHISANITNISRDDLDFEWIIQIKKSPKSISEGDISEYPESKVAFIETIPGSVGAQKSTILKYQWFPQSNGIYFYNMYIWNESSAKALSYPFMRSFLDDNWIIVKSNLNSVTNQIKSGIPIDEIQCREGLQLAHKTSNGNIVCVKQGTLQKLRDRGWADTSGIILKQRSSQTIHDLTEKSDRIITGIVTDKETIGNTTMVWVGVYEWLKKNPNYDSIILDITKYSSESNLDFQKGDELLLFLKDIDLQNGHFGIFYLNSETKPEKYPLDMKEYVDSFVKPEDKGREYLYQENENCKNITWENDPFLYCTYLEEEFRYYIPILVTVDRVKQKMLHQVSEEYFAEHFDLKRAYDTAIANGHTIPTGQDLEFDYKIGNQKFLYRVSVSGNNEAYISYFQPREIQSLPHENRMNELVQTCLERGSYPIFWDRVAVSHVEKGFTPMITGGTPAIYDRYGNAVLHPTKQQFRLWPETGEIECGKDMQDFDSIPIELQKRELLIDSTEFLKIKTRK